MGICSPPTGKQENRFYQVCRLRTPYSTATASCTRLGSRARSGVDRAHLQLLLTQSNPTLEQASCLLERGKGRKTTRHPSLVTPSSALLELCSRNPNTSSTHSFSLYPSQLATPQALGRGGLTCSLPVQQCSLSPNEGARKRQTLRHWGSPTIRAHALIECGD